VVGDELVAGSGDVVLARERGSVLIGILGHLNFLGAGPPTGIVAGDLEGAVVGIEDGNGVVGGECEGGGGEEGGCHEEKQAVFQVSHKLTERLNGNPWPGFLPLPH
jgi:hypothetical protein